MLFAIDCWNSKDALPDSGGGPCSWKRIVEQQPWQQGRQTETGRDRLRDRQKDGQRDKETDRQRQKQKKIAYFVFLQSVLRTVNETERHVLSGEFQAFGVDIQWRNPHLQQFLPYVGSNSPFWLSATTRLFTVGWKVCSFMSGLISFRMWDKQCHFLPLTTGHSQTLWVHEPDVFFDQVVDKAIPKKQGLQNFAAKHLVQHPLSADIARDVVSQKVVKM